MKDMIELKNIERGGQNYACPSLTVVEIAAEGGFAASEDAQKGIMTGIYVDGEEF